MLSATTKVMFIDSIVVDKDSFLYNIPLNKESGNLFMNIDDKSNEGTGYMNEFGNRRFFSDSLSTAGRLIYSTDLVGGSWSKPVALEGIGDEFVKPNYPFLMSDGLTLLFAAEGEKSLGGYDIFTTLFDTESGKYYQPENYGLPFNSEANDYLVAIDELDSLGWLVSDRYQPEGKVCIYTFVPTKPRMNFEADNLTDEELTKYAKIEGIDETWKFGDRAAAVQRLNDMLEKSLKEIDDERIEFAINDDVTYHSLKDFKSSKTRQAFMELNGLKGSLMKKQQDLEKQREKYSAANNNVKAGMRQVMLRAEREIDTLSEQIKQREKEIRNEENKL